MSVSVLIEAVEAGRINTERTLRRWRNDGRPLSVQIGQPTRSREDEMRVPDPRRVGRSGDIIEDEHSRAATHSTGTGGIAVHVLGAVGMCHDPELLCEGSGDITGQHSLREE